MGISPCCVYFLVIIYMFRLGQVKNGSKSESRWVRVSVKANNIRNLDPSLSLFTICLCYFVLNAVSLGLGNSKPQSTPFILSNLKTKN